MTKSPAKNSRRKFLWTALSLLFSWPLLRFISFRVPVKPVKIKVTEPLSSSGVIIQKDFVLFERHGKCWALSRRCTHLGCTLNYHEADDLLECPCHQSRFQIDSGKVIKGPAKRSLTLFQVEKSAKGSGYVVTIKS